MAEQKHDASYAFAEFSDSSGWSSDDISWLVGLLSTVYPFLGYDAAAHMAEELPEPARYVPIAMVGSIVINGVIGLIYAIVLLFALGDLDDLLASPTGFPFMQLFLNVTNSRIAATILSLIISLVAATANSADLTSTSRTAWAFARDRAALFSSYFAHLQEKRAVPTRMIMCISVLQGLLGFLYLGNTTAFNAVLSMAILGMSATSPQRVVPGPFTLGRFGAVVNVVAIAWLLLAMLFSMFPSFQPVVAQNMNYSSVVLADWIFFGVLYYSSYQRKSYKGPIGI